MRKIKSEGLSEVKKEDHLKFRTFEKFGTLFDQSPLFPPRLCVSAVKTHILSD